MTLHGISFIHHKAFWFALAFLVLVVASFASLDLQWGQFLSGLTWVRGALTRNPLRWYDVLCLSGQAMYYLTAQAN